MGGSSGPTQPNNNNNNNSPVSSVIPPLGVQLELEGDQHLYQLNLPNLRSGTRRRLRCLRLILVEGCLVIPRRRLELLPEEEEGGCLGTRRVGRRGEEGCLGMLNSSSSNSLRRLEGFSGTRRLLTLEEGCLGVRQGRIQLEEDCSGTLRMLLLPPAQGQLEGFLVLAPPPVRLVACLGTISSSSKANKGKLSKTKATRAVPK